MFLTSLLLLGDLLLAPNTSSCPDLTYSALESRLSLTPSGSLLVRDLGWRDRGAYRCYFGGPEDDVPSLGRVEVTLDVSYRQYIYYFSLIYGAVSAVGLLLLTLLYKLVYWLLET